MPSRYQLKFPCSEQQFDDAREIAEHFFEDSSLPYQTVKNWWRRNNEILTCLIDTNTNTVKGYFEILPITEICAGRLERYLIDESGIRSEDIIPAADKDFVQYLYISGIAVLESRPCKAILHQAIVSKITYLYDSDNLKKIYATPITDEGKKIIENPRNRFEKNKVGLFTGQQHPIWFISHENIPQVINTYRHNRHTETCAWIEKLCDNLDIYQNYL